MKRRSSIIGTSSINSYLDTIDENSLLSTPAKKQRKKRQSLSGSDIASPLRMSLRITPSLLNEAASTPVSLLQR